MKEHDADFEGHKWTRCDEKLPPAGMTVFIEGGKAVWTGKRWLTLMQGVFGREIQWPVTHWMSKE